MLFVRGIKGKLKLSPGVKLWGGLLLLLVVIVGGIAYRVMGFRDTVEACWERGGVWIGGALRSSYCAEDPTEKKGEW
jgi:hypothetical protein